MTTAPVPLHDPRRTLGAPAMRDAAAQVLAQGRYIDGEHVARFERDFAASVGAAHRVGVGNGTDALEIALRAVGVGSGDRVLTVANAGFYATSAILAAGARPVFADVQQRVLPDEPGGPLPGAAAAVYTHLYGDISGGGCP